MLDASLIDSDKVGWAWQINAISSAEAPISIDTTNSPFVYIPLKHDAQALLNVFCIVGIIKINHLI